MKMEKNGFQYIFIKMEKISDPLNEGHFLVLIFELE